MSMQNLQDFNPFDYCICIIIFIIFFQYNKMLHDLKVFCKKNSIFNKKIKYNFCIDLIDYTSYKH